MATLVGPLELDELKVIRFDFTSEVEDTTTIGTPVVTCVLLDGVDATPANVLIGTPLINGFFATQQVRPGVAGCLYKLRATVLDGDGNKHGITCHLKVVPA